METEALDPYWKLRPPSATPEGELCTCLDRPPLVLLGWFSLNPIMCLKCKGEVPPERIGFSAELAEQIAFWRNLHEALLTLWLDSSDYESWGRAQLEDPNGRVNTWGLELVRALSGRRRTYYEWFQDSSADDFAPLSQCPRCSGGLKECSGQLVCESCSIVVPNRE